MFRELLYVKWSSRRIWNACSSWELANYCQCYYHHYYHCYIYHMNIHIYIYIYIYTHTHGRMTIFRASVQSGAWTCIWWKCPVRRATLRYVSCLRFPRGDFLFKWTHLTNTVHKNNTHPGARSSSLPAAASGWRESTFRKGGCSGNRVQWFTLYYRLFYYMILPPSTAPPSDCTPLWWIPSEPRGDPTSSTRSAWACNILA